MATLEGPDEGIGPLIMRIPGDNMNGECRSPCGHEYENPMPLKTILYLLCDENPSFEDYVSAKI